LAGGVLAETIVKMVSDKNELNLGGTYFAERTLPKKTSSTSEGWMPALSTAALKKVSLEFLAK